MRTVAFGMLAGFALLPVVESPALAEEQEPKSCSATTPNTLSVGQPEERKLADIAADARRLDAVLQRATVCRPAQGKRAGLFRERRP
jgi:hypothetical protein